MNRFDYLHSASVLDHIKLCTDHYHLVLKVDERFGETLPGQFVNLKINNREELLLRRPFSIARISPENSSIEIVYRVAGKGTGELKKLRPGEAVDLLGPFGRGFSVPEEAVRCLLVGGGVGIAPLWGLAEQLSLKKKETTALLGFRSRDYLFGIGRFEALGIDTRITTDDGSYGLKGLISDHLEGFLKEPPDRVYVCGPPLMLQDVIPMIRKRGVAGEASLEERMGCGYGVCFSCVVNIRKAGGIEKQRVCTEGPVFDLKDIVLENET